MSAITAIPYHLTLAYVVRGKNSARLRYLEPEEGLVIRRIPDLLEVKTHRVGTTGEPVQGGNTLSYRSYPDLLKNK